MGTRVLLLARWCAVRHTGTRAAHMVLAAHVAGGTHREAIYLRRNYRSDVSRARLVICCVLRSDLLDLHLGFMELVDVASWIHSAKLPSLHSKRKTQHTQDNSHKRRSLHAPPSLHFTVRKISTVRSSRARENSGQARWRTSSPRHRDGAGSQQCGAEGTHKERVAGGGTDEGGCSTTCESIAPDMLALLMFTCEELELILTTLRSSIHNLPSRMSTAPLLCKRLLFLVRKESTIIAQPCLSMRV